MIAKRIALLLGVGLFAWILSSMDLAAVWSQMKEIKWGFGIILLFYGVVFGLDTLGWRFALKTDPGSRVRWDRLFRARLAGEALNYVTPAAWVGGEPVKAYLLSRRYGVPLSEGMASVVIAKTTFSLSMLLFILAGLLMALSAFPLGSSFLVWIWVALGVLTILMGALLASQFLRPFERSTWFLRWVAPRWHKKLSHRFQEWDRKIVSFYRESPRALFGSLAFHFLGWLAGVVEVYLILKFLNIPATWMTAWILEALWTLLKGGAFLIPASLGASEGFLLLICGILGINAVSGLAMGLIRRARELVWVSLGLLEFSRAR